METPLKGRRILIVEDEPLIALNLSQHFEEEGATVTVAPTLAQALWEVEDPGLSGAIVDHALGDDFSTAVCERMKARKLPLVTHSGYSDKGGPCGGVAHVNKPAAAAVVVEALKGLLIECARFNRPPAV